MGRLAKVVIAAGFAATVVTPAVATAQPGDRAATALFVGPTGRVQPKGEGYFKAVGISVPVLQGGVTDRFSMGVGVPLFALGHGVLITPKFQVHRSDKHSTSIGTVAFIGESSGGIAYLAHTIELEAGAVHMSVIKPIEGFAEGRAIGFMLGAEHRLNERVLLMTENYIFGGGAPIISGGLRIKMPHTTLDVGWLAPLGFMRGPSPLGAPMFNIGYKF